MKAHSIITLLPVVLCVLLAAGCAAQPAAPASPAPATATTAPTATAVPTDTPAPEQPTLALTEPAESPIPESGAVDPAGEPVRFVLVPEQSEARYRVREQLANLSLPNDAVGRTKQVSGEVVILPDGTVDTAASRFVVDLSTLQSDQSRRDNYLRRNVLQTDQYPTAVFVPKKVGGLALPLPETGEVAFHVTGDLTIRDVTREVTWAVSGNFDGSQGTGTAVTEFTFPDFNLTQPQVPMVLGIEDRIILEVDVAIRR